MSIKGVKQLKEMVIRYSDYDGSSKGVREWMRKNLIQFASNNPDVAVKTELKRCVHPYVRGNYLNGNTKTICIKNLEPAAINGYVDDLRNQVGWKTSTTGYKRPVVSKCKSVQGEWHERMDLVSLDLKVTMK